MVLGCTSTTGAPLSFQTKNAMAKKTKREAQNAAILKHLLSGKAIDPMDALSRFGCMRLSGRIYDCRKILAASKKDLSIVTKMITLNGHHVAQYVIEKR
jgi:hypothetical protein